MHSLIEILQDGQFHSGEELGERLKMSRAGVWKKLQRLESEFGLNIQAVKGRGYCLSHPLSLLNLQRINQASLDWPIHYSETLASTSSRAQQLLREGATEPFVVVAERQTAGRGRRGRAWQSPYAENIYFSAALPISGGVRALEGVSLVVGLAVLQALEPYNLEGVGLKWPNDILVGGKKISGILLELSGDPSDCGYLVIGVGINVNMHSNQAVDQPWTSVALECGKIIDRSALVIALVDSLKTHLDLFAEGGFAAFQLQWQSHHLWQGREALLSTANQVVQGVILGVDNGGALRFQVDGVEQVFSGGELSLRLADDT